MKTVILKSLIITIITLVLTVLLRNGLQTPNFLTDVGGLGAFVTVFGTLYGIMAAFVVVEVWAQYNKTSNLIDQEALGLERLFRLTLYFRDAKLTQRMHAVIKHYGALSETRTERITHCLMRLPSLLKFFLYMTSGAAVIVFILMPFANTWYHAFVVGTITFVIAMVLQLIEDLDNPFVGNWNINADPFKRALDHIEEDY